MLTERRYDIDWLRVITIALLLIYHIAIVFQPWGFYIGFIQSMEAWESLWIPMSMLNIWRIPLLFFVSGIGVCFAIQKRDAKQLLSERSKRIFLPFLFGVLFIVPIHIMIWQKYYGQTPTYHFSQGHLWFLANIFIYVIVLSPLFFYLKRKNGKFQLLLQKLLKTPLALIVVSISFVLESIIMKPDPFEMYALSMHGFYLGLLAFFFGFCFVLSGNIFWNNLAKWKYLYFFLAVILYSIRYVEFQLKAPVYLMAIESVTWIFAVLGFAYQYLNRPSRILSYLSQAAYPIYILHMIFLYAASYVILPLSISVVLKFTLIVAFTFTGCYVCYETIRRNRILRLFFGLKTPKSKKLQLELQ